ncbi:hypothetical protein PC121_g20157 [Phytophthora cactorum]|nr:hypothetical protein PC120_g19864 [Phytophthora cactorum]KAG3047275.1 hypothetical protein PC121_g20157 [Phytophthora cactorum]
MVQASNVLLHFVDNSGSTLYYMRQLTTKVIASKRFTQAKKCPYR